MESAIKSIWQDEEGFVVTIEIILIATIVGIGSIVGLTCVRDALNSELGDIADCIESLDLCGDDDSVAVNEGDSAAAAAGSCISFTAPPRNER